MKPEFMRLRRALSGAVAAVLLAAAFVVFSPALSASAHHNTITAAASCVNYQWTITWTITNSEWDKTETVTYSSDPAIIAQGTTIDMGGTYTRTETVSGPVDKTLTVSATWSNGVKQTNSKTVRTTDFAGTCTPPPPPPSTPKAPVIALLVAPCVTGGALGAVTARMSDLISGTTYRLSLHASDGTVLETKEHQATGASFETSFAQRGSGTYYATVTIGTGQVLASSANATITDCPSEVTVAVQLEPCASLLGLSEREIGVLVDGLAPSRVYTVQLLDAAGTVIATATTPGDDVSAFAHTFTGFTVPGEYSISVLGESEPVVSPAVAVPLCDLDTLAPPSIELTAGSCVSTTPAVLSARMGDLDPTRTYYVRVVTASGAAVAGGADRMISGTTTGTLTFADITAPGDYTAQLLIDPGKQLAATSPASTSLGMCLPTLAMTGPGALVPLGAVAALLLTLGGAVVTGRLRRRVAL